VRCSKRRESGAEAWGKGEADGVTRLKVAVLGGIVLLLGLFLLVRLTTEIPVARVDVVWACGRKVLPGYQGIPREARDDFAELRKDIAKGMRLDCGIYGPQATRASGG
jgi:hypothetical protein